MLHMIGKKPKAYYYRRILSCHQSLTMSHSQPIVQKIHVGQFRFQSHWSKITHFMLLLIQKEEVGCFCQLCIDMFLTEKVSSIGFLQMLFKSMVLVLKLYLKFLKNKNAKIQMMTDHVLSQKVKLNHCQIKSKLKK
jgi:hypothetical protein